MLYKFRVTTKGVEGQTPSLTLENPLVVLVRAAFGASRGPPLGVPKAGLTLNVKKRKKLSLVWKVNKGREQQCFSVLLLHFYSYALRHIIILVDGKILISLQG